MFEKADTIIARRTNSYGLKKPLDAARICYIAKKVANGSFEPISFKNGVLKIRVKNSIEAQNIQLNSAQIIQKINKKIKENLLKRIIFCIE